MKIQIDQSGKIEETNRDTILAFANHETYSIKIHRRTKRKILEQFRLRGKPKLYTLRTFSAGICLLLRDHPKKFQEVAIDTEYFGKNQAIKSMIEEMLGSKAKNMIPISFTHIGKRSRAHLLALSVFRGKQKANRVVTYGELFKWAIQKSR